MHRSFDTHYRQLYSVAYLCFKYVFPDNEIILVFFEESYSICEFELQEFELDYGHLKGLVNSNRHITNGIAKILCQSLVRATSA